MKTPQEILERLGVKAVLLPIRKGTKAPALKKWQETSFSETQSPAYQQKLCTAPSIGVALGSASEGLCSIDFDCEEFLAEFLALNDLLAHSLRTKGKRGANIWLILEGTIPKSRKLRALGRDVGEWRAGGNQTIIAGTHPEGMPYAWLCDAPPVRISFDALKWPATNERPSPPFPSYSSPSSPSSPPSPSLHPLHNIEEKSEREELARNALKASTAKLYKRWISHKYHASQGTRNHHLVQMVTFLFHAVGSKQLSFLTGAFYDLNQSMFIDSREQHQREAEAHAKACRETWLASLIEEDRALVQGLGQRYEEAFRICQDLAGRSYDGLPDGVFFLSCSDLASRLDLEDTQALRILQAFQSYEIMEVHEKGTRHAKGQKGRATRWKWRRGTTRQGL